MTTDVVPRRGRPPRIDREEILDAVITRLDLGWTMASVARDLGVSEPTIYYYFPTKQDLQSALGERLLDELSRPVFDGDWAAWLIETAEAFYAHVLRYPFLLDVQTALPLASGRGNLLLLEESLAVLTSAGFTIADASSAIVLVLAVVTQHATSVVNWQRLAGEDIRTRVTELARTHQASRSLDLYQSDEPWDFAAQFSRALTIVVAGIRAELAVLPRHVGQPRDGRREIGE